MRIVPPEKKNPNRRSLLLGEANGKKQAHQTGFFVPILHTPPGARTQSSNGRPGLWREGYICRSPWAEYCLRADNGKIREI